MSNRKRADKKKKQNSEIMKFLKFGLVPLIVILLIAVIMAADHQGEKKRNDSLSAETPEGKEPQDADRTKDDPETETYGETDKIDMEEYEDGRGQAELLGSQEPDQEPPAEILDPFQQPLQQDVLLELTGLVRLYCEAKTNCDPELLAQVFGIKDWSEERKEQEREKMELVKASVKSYENISCYSVQGPKTGSYVIFPYYEIRYRETDTLVPAVSWAYVEQDESGQYHIVGETDENTKEYIRRAGEKPEVKAVIAQIQAKQLQAIGSDETLQKIYGDDKGSEVIIGGQR